MYRDGEHNEEGSTEEKDSVASQVPTCHSHGPKNYAGSEKPRLQGHPHGAHASGTHTMTCKELSPSLTVISNLATFAKPVKSSNAGHGGFDPF